MSLLRIDSSIRGAMSASRALADTVQSHWLEQHPDLPVVTRDLAASPIPPASWMAAVSGSQTPLDQRTEAQRAGVALAQELYDEVRAASTIILATGLYNLGTNQLVKAWIDMLIVIGAPPEEIMQGKDVALVVARGGYYGNDGPRFGWDHATPWLTRILAEVWGANLTLVERDFTLVGVDPRLDEFEEQGAALKLTADAAAAQAGGQLAASYAARTLV